MMILTRYCRTNKIQKNTHSGVTQAVSIENEIARMIEQKITQEHNIGMILYKIWFRFYRINNLQLFISLIFRKRNFKLTALYRY